MSGECENGPDEAGRIAAVRRYDVLDSPPDGAFERVTALAARLLDVPIAIVSIVDADRIWFKSHHGLDATQIDRSPGLCASAILHDGPWVLADASTDARALSNPLVAGEFGLRFYAGVPLTTHDGFNLGTLCVIDREPRETTDDQLATLADLAALVMDELELRLSSRKAVGLEAELRRAAEDMVATMRRNRKRMEGLERIQGRLLEHMPDGVVMWGGDGQIVAANPAAAALLGLSHGELLDPSSLAPLRARLLAQDGRRWKGATPPVVALHTGVSQRDQIVGVPNPPGGTRWLSMSSIAHRNREGTVDYVVTSLSDVTARHAAWLAVAGEHKEKRGRVQNILRTGAVKMVFQPIVALDTGRIFGAEALARFPGRRDKVPDAWFAEAADVNLGAELEVAAVRAALCELDRLPAETYLFVNVSPACVTSAELHRLLAEVPAGRVVLELTEHTLVPNYEELERSLSDLRAGGVLVAVDDAGAGFASMQHILNLRPDVIKLDHALTHGIEEDPARRALVSALLKFGTEIGADILAEGVETEAQLASLRVLGVRYGQGYLLGEPTALPLPPSSSRGRLRPTRRGAGALRF